MIGVSCPVCWKPIKSLTIDLPSGCKCPDRADRFSDLNLNHFEIIFGIELQPLTLEALDFRLSQRRKDNPS